MSRTPRRIFNGILKTIPDDLHQIYWDLYENMEIKVKISYSYGWWEFLHNKEWIKIREENLKIIK